MDRIENIVGGVVIQRESHIVIQLDEARDVLSSTVLNGGFTHADAVANLKVSKHSENACEEPRETLARFVQSISLAETTVGMMTAASMESLRTAEYSYSDFTVTALVTSGLSNPRCAGDPADYQQLPPVSPEPGTINTVIVLSHQLSSAALAEALMVVTEAKAVALHRNNVTSPVSGKIATGTGTDSIAIVNGVAEPVLHYCGKHTKVGELIAKSTIDAVHASIQWDLQNNTYNNL